MKRALLMVLAGAGVIASYAIVDAGGNPGFSVTTVARLALPGLVTALIMVAWTIERRRADQSAGKVSELSAQLIRKEIELEHLAMIDELTGLYARRSFDEHLRLEFERTRRHKRALSLLLLEVDNLHGLTEKGGKLGRGFILSHVGELIRANVRINDVAARYTPDVLALLLPETNAEAARDVAEKLRGQVEVNSFGNNYFDTPVRVTLSQGIACVPAPGIDSIDALRGAAEQALAEAKAEGIDRVRVHGDGPSRRAA
ncbi:MAG TPA: GGDEF domain-containing protein [Dehalococcoidia bacterium]|nr:GGDEF domain-containing protein [Dehalococcoidia bacterium]